ncbi:hypothetical protein [Methanosarcina barkeri]|uniref:hypothetical protein n=1 Tax=Methanosarcina barkeri TaxID=2208 RepID=UPI000AE91E27|nr:hypothetical protein [Methanosarcina barkeri]
MSESKRILGARYEIVDEIGKPEFLIGTKFYKSPKKILSFWEIKKHSALKSKETP